MIITQEETIAIVVERIRNHPFLEKIILFGSRARGEQRQNSDFDFLVIFQKIENKRKKVIEIMKQLADLREATDIIVCTLEDIEINRHRNWSIITNAMKEGKLIYESKR
jgi:predicted nucleotidyltransferase